MTRRIFQFVLPAVLLCAATAACAQRGGGPGGPGGGAPGGGGGVSAGAGNNPSGKDNHGYDSHGGVTVVPGFPNTGKSVLSMPNHGIHSMGLSGRWWDDSHTVKTLGLSADQRKQMDQIFEANRAAITERFTALLAEQKMMNEMPSKDLSDENKVNTAVDRVTEARAALERTTSGVLQQIRSKLTEAQQAKLDDAISRQ